jgi:hypothetical protein
MLLHSAVANMAINLTGKKRQSFNLDIQPVSSRCSLAHPTLLTTLPRTHSAHEMMLASAPTERVDGMVGSRVTAYRVVNQAERKYPK